MIKKSIKKVIFTGMSSYLHKINSCIVSWGERIASGVIAMSIISIAALLFTQQFWGFFCERFFSATSTEVTNSIDLLE